MNLREKRTEKGLTMREVAVGCGMNTSSYCDIERGRRSTKPDKAKKIAAVLGFDWTEFYEDPEPAEAES